MKTPQRRFSPVSAYPLAVWMSHGDEALELPAGIPSHRRHFQRPGRASPTSSAASGPCSSIPRFTTRRSARNCSRIFSSTFAKPGGDWTPAHFIESTVASIREKVGSGHVICGLSGGVDSSVAAMLVHRAIGSQLTCIFVNNGVLRKNEFQNVQKNLRDKLGLNIVAVDASARFLEQLAGVTDPEIEAQAHRPGVHRRL